MSMRGGCDADAKSTLPVVDFVTHLWFRLEVQTPSCLASVGDRVWHMHIGLRSWENCVRRGGRVAPKSWADEESPDRWSGRGLNLLPMPDGWLGKVEFPWSNNRDSTPRKWPLQARTSWQGPEAPR